MQASDLVKKLESDEITIAEFQLGLFNLMKQVFVSGLMVFGFVYSDYYDKEIRSQINYLDRFGLDLKNGRNFGSLEHRAKLYILSGTYFFEELVRKQSIKAGYIEKKRVCDNSSYNTDWTRINTTDHIIDGVVGVGCNCHYEFR